MKRRYVVSLLFSGLLVFWVLSFESLQPSAPTTTASSSTMPVVLTPIWNFDRFRGYLDGYFGAKRQVHPCAYISHSPSSAYTSGVLSGFADASAS